jgi:hypothetical protein
MLRPGSITNNPIVTLLLRHTSYSCLFDIRLLINAHNVRPGAQPGIACDVSFSGVRSPKGGAAEEHNHDLGSHAFPNLLKDPIVVDGQSDGPTASENYCAASIVSCFEL